MKTYNLFYAIGLLIILVSCSPKDYYKDCSSFGWEAFDKKGIKLQGKVVSFDEEILNPVRIHCLDSLLVLTNRNTPLFLDKYNLNSMTKIGSGISFGSGPNEMVIISQIQKTDSAIYLLDAMQRKIKKYLPSDFYSFENPEPRQIITLEESCNGVLLLPDNKIVGCSFSSEGKRFSIFDQFGKLIKHKGEYPDFGKELKEYEEIEAFICTMSMSEDYKHFALVYKITDLIEIYDVEGNLKKRIQGPEGIFPMLKQKSAGEEIRVAHTKGETRDAYFSPVAYNNELWVIYSGKYFDPKESHRYLRDTILVFDWEGKPLRYYTLDIPILAFSINKEKKKLYGITDRPDFQIISYDII